MTPGGARPAGRPVPVDELRIADHIELLGVVVEVRDLRDHADFPAALQAIVRRVPDGQPTSTLVARDLVVVGWYLPRRVRLRCIACLWPMLRDIDLALGIPTRGLCVLCAQPTSYPRAILPVARLCI